MNNVAREGNVEVTDTEQDGDRDTTDTDRWTPGLCSPWPREVKRLAKLEELS